MKSDDFLTPQELAARWSMHPGSLAHWRVKFRGPEWIKKGWMVLYPLKAIEKYEKQHPELREKRS